MFAERNIRMNAEANKNVQLYDSDKIYLKCILNHEYYQFNTKITRPI